MSKRVTIIVRKKDQWIIDELESIVETKRQLGSATTLGFELMRVARFGLTGRGQTSLREKLRTAGIVQEKQDEH